MSLDKDKLGKALYPRENRKCFRCKSKEYRKADCPLKIVSQVDLIAKSSASITEPIVDPTLQDGSVEVSSKVWVAEEEKVSQSFVDGHLCRRAEETAFSVEVLSHTAGVQLNCSEQSCRRRSDW